MFLRVQRFKVLRSGQQLDHAACAEYRNGALEVVGLHGHRYPSSHTVEMAHEKTTVAQEPLLEIAKRVFGRSLVAAP